MRRVSPAAPRPVVLVDIKAEPGANSRGAEPFGRTPLLPWAISSLLRGNPLHWEPLPSPLKQATTVLYKLIVKVRAAFILLRSAWLMKPSHFRPETNSIYKNLGWGIPLIPGNVYAWGAQGIFAPTLAKTLPEFPLWTLVLANTMYIAFTIYFIALLGFGFHAFMCGIGKLFAFREAPPPYEFFLVRTAGAFMWFALLVCLMAVPVLAQRPDLIGYLAARAFAFPLLWAGLFLTAGLSWQRAGAAGRVGLKEMYESERFVSLVWRTECSLTLLTFSALFLLARHPDFLLPHQH